MSTEEIQSIRESLHRIEKAIVGDPDMGHKGLAERMTAVEAKADHNDRKLLVWGGIATGVSVVITHLKIKLFGP